MHQLKRFAAAVIIVTVAVLSLCSSYSTYKRSLCRNHQHHVNMVTSLTEDELYSEASVPRRGIIDYIGRTSIPPSGEEVIDASVNSRWSTHSLSYKPITKRQLTQTRLNLWRQYPWKKFKGKAVLKIKLGGGLSIESTPGSRLPFSGPVNLESIDSLADLSTLLLYGAYDPRIKGIFVELGPVQCGYAKLQEARRMMSFFRQSGKEIIGYAEVASEKELFLSLGFDEFYIPPDGILDLRGFSASATFLRGIFDKIGIEPQVQRIGKYKSFGDTFNRTTISEAQREVISSLLSEASDFWVDSIAKEVNKTAVEIRQLWAERRVQSPYDYRDKGLITGVKYLDQVEEIVKFKFSDYKQPPRFNLVRYFHGLLSGNEDHTQQTLQNNSAYRGTVEDLQDFDLKRDFSVYPRRMLSSNMTVIEENINATTARNKRAVDVNSLFTIPRLLLGGGYLRRMRRGSVILAGLPYKEMRYGPRIAVINAVGSISSGESGNSPLGGKSIGSNTLISLIKRAKQDSNIKAVVLRIDSPGGSALASDVMWRELRSLSRLKPVVASQVDVAASGGYYLSMACDQIVAEELTVTGSIGVVTSKFNAEKLNERIGYSSETISIGRYAEVFSTTRGFTAEEEAYFEGSAQKFYQSFITKAAASRSMGVAEMNEVAQGRVWTGLQGHRIGLVDHIGGLWKALELATDLSIVAATTDDPVKFNMKRNSLDRNVFRVQVLQEPRKGLGLPFGLQASSTDQSLQVDGNVIARCDDIIASTDLVSPEAMGYSPVIGQLFSNPVVSALMKTANLKESDLMKLLFISKSNGNSNNYLVNIWASMQSTFNDVFSSNQDFIDY